jgi:hypothetical protein
MKFEVVAKTLAASAVAVLIAGCGGGGGGGSPASTSSLELSGTAAVGAALADAEVQVKCAQGAGTATTTTAGGYTVSISGGALPCIIKVSGTHNGVAVSLHSLAQSGTSANGNTTAVANVTPVTEMIVAQLAASLPADVFANFNPGQVTQEALAGAVTAIVDALKAAGIDLSGIDPLQATLVPGSAANAYDVLLDKLGETVPAESLPLVVNQVAAAAATQSTTGLTDAMVAVSGGSLAGCPQALSGKYRSLEYTGGTAVHTVDFKAMTLTTEGGSAETIVAGSAPCEFSVGPTKIVVGTQGAGAFAASDMGGYFFPVQAHPIASIAGAWNFMESGINETNTGEHFFGKFTVNTDNSVSVCEYDVMNGVANFTTCVPDTDETISVAAAADGSFNLQYGTEGGKVYGYRSPAGALNLFGTNNPSGDSATTAFRTHFVMTRPNVQALPAVGTVSKYWDATISFATGNLTASPLTADSVTVTAADAGGSTFTRTRTSDSRVDTFQVNYPVEGLRYRAASPGLSSLYMMPMPGLGISAMIDNMPAHFYGIAINRP